MRIDIGNKYCVTSDPNQFKVNQRSVPPKFDTNKDGTQGEEQLKALGYLPNLNSCYKFLLKYQILVSKASGFRELMDEVARIEKELDDSIRI